MQAQLYIPFSLPSRSAAEQPFCRPQKYEPPEGLWGLVACGLMPMLTYHEKMPVNMSTLRAVTSAQLTLKAFSEGVSVVMGRLMSTPL